MGIRVRAKRICYHNHKRWKVGEIFEIRNMNAFSEISMKLVDEKAVDEAENPEDQRSSAALSEGSKTLLHQGKVIDPKNAGAAADVAADAAEKERRAKLTDEERAAEDKEKEEASEQGPPKENETDGNEDVI